MKTKFTVSTAETIRLRISSAATRSGWAESRAIIDVNGDFYSADANIRIAAGTDNTVTVHLIEDSNAGRSPFGTLYGLESDAQGTVNYSFQVGAAPVPEPSSHAALAFGLVGALRARRCRVR